MLLGRSTTRATLATTAAVVTLTLTCTAATAAGGAPARSAAPATHGAVLGYIESGDSLTALRRNLPAVTSVGVDGVNVTNSGAGVASPDRGARKMLTVIHRAGKTAELLVGNYSDKINDFDPAIAHRLFVSSKHRHAVIASLVADARHGWNGIQLDLESLHATDRKGLTRFTSELRAALPAHKSLSMAVMASTSTRGYRAGGYDLPALAKRLTRVVLMTYDQHGPTWSGAGPIGGLPWAKRAMAALLKSVPRHKAMLGVAGYGYTWPAHGTGTQLGDAAARRAAVSPQWDTRQAEWHSALRGGGTEWWSDARSLHVRRSVARSLRIRGVAVWSLGLGDPITQ